MMIPEDGDYWYQRYVDLRNAGNKLVALLTLCVEVDPELPSIEEVRSTYDDAMEEWKRLTK